MTPADIITTGEHVESTLIAFAGLIGINQLPGPITWSLDTQGHWPTVDVVLPDLPTLRRWADATDAEVTHAYADTWLAFTMFGGVRLVLSTSSETVQGVAGVVQP
jgi:hypothetical protein